MCTWEVRVVFSSASKPTSPKEGVRMVVGAGLSRYPNAFIQVIDTYKWRRVGERNIGCERQVALLH